MIGYRAFVKVTGRMNKVKGVVRNLDDGSVEIYAEAEEKILRKFYEEIINDKEIEGMVITEKEFIREDEKNYKKNREPKDFKFMDIDYGEEITNKADKESLERSEIAIFYFNKLRKENKEGFDRVSKESRDGFTKVENKLDSGFSGVEKKLDNGFGGVEKKLDSGFDGVRTDLRGFNNSTQQRFDKLDNKYHTVSDRLASIDDHLKELVDILKKFAPK